MLDTVTIGDAERKKFGLGDQGLPNIKPQKISILLTSMAAERIGGGEGRANKKKWGLAIWTVRGESGGMPPGNCAILHALKCVLGAPEALYCACTQYIYTCKLLSSISGFRSKRTTYGALASRLRSSHVRLI